jgi:predicted Zn-ribbon and HTH transcriptional regulator
MQTFESRQTIRHQIFDLLISEDLTVRDISQAVRIPEKEVLEHLVHIDRTAQRLGKKLVITPYRCLVCGFVFEKRTRLSKPGRCPVCKKSHLQQASYRVT